MRLFWHQHILGHRVSRRSLGHHAYVYRCTCGARWSAIGPENQ